MATLYIARADALNPTSYTDTYTYTHSIERLTDVTSGNVYVYRFAEYEYGFVAPGDDPRLA